MERDQTLQLPDEILDQIIRDAGPRYGTAASHTTFPGKENWLSCASVCRRWHNITLPHSFRYIRVSPLVFKETATDYVAHKFNAFLHDNPSIVPLIQEVNFLRCMIATPTLISILGTLRNLQYLVLHRSLVHGSLHPQQPSTNFKLCKLLVTGGACDVYDRAEEVCGGQIPRLLCLFSEIEEFEDLRGCGHEDRFVQDLDGEAARTFSLSAKFEPLYLATMRRLDLFNHITCLQLKVSFNVTESGAEGCDLFRVMGPTLKELCLTLIMHLSDRSTPQRDILETFCSGLVLCSSLHGFRLHLEDTEIHGNIAASPDSAAMTLPTAFSVGIDIIALLNPTKLRHLSFAYPTYMHPRASSQDIRALDLARLRDICRRYVNLESLNLVAYDVYDTVDVKTVFKTFANEELSEFKSILRHDEPGEFFRCSEPTCAWFSGGKLNTIIAFHRDVLKSYWMPR